MMSTARTVIALIAFIPVALLPASPLAADAWTVGELRIEHPWSRATPPGTPVGAGYMTIVNTSDRTDRLVGAESPAAGRVQIHRSAERDGMTSMIHQPEGVAVPAGGEVEFRPGGYHLMLMALAEPLVKGERIPLTLRFERAGRVELELVVRALTAGPPDGD